MPGAASNARSGAGARSIVGMFFPCTGLLLLLGPSLALVAPPPLRFAAAAPKSFTDDPLVGKLLRSGTLPRSTSLDDYAAKASGLSTWRRALAAGRCPDFGGVDADSVPWPPEPLLGSLNAAMASLGLPRTTARHPSLIAAALAAVLASTVCFEEEATAATVDVNDDGLEEEFDPYGDDGDAGSEAEEAADADNSEATSEERQLEEAARQIADAFAAEWGAPLVGVRAIEGLGAADGGDAGALTAAPGTTFSPADGLWQHVGWKSLESVQKQLRELTELSALISSLGQRAASDGVPERGPGSSRDERAAPSAALSPLAPRELSGLCHTGDLGRVAPSELTLLATAPGACGAHDGSRSGSSDGGSDVGAEEGSDVGGRGRRRLFLSRLAERRLLGYSLEGWSETAGRPLPKRPARLPRTRGGPLVVCLDTSHSMAGGREKLAKAVVLEAVSIPPQLCQQGSPAAAPHSPRPASHPGTFACYLSPPLASPQVRSAHSQGRPCLLFAFSGKSDLAELALTPPPRAKQRRRRRTADGSSGAGVTDRRSLSKLLDFLACSFGGGTDVAGPLRRALDVLEQPTEEEVVYSGAVSPSAWRTPSPLATCQLRPATSDPCQPHRSHRVLLRTCCLCPTVSCPTRLSTRPRTRGCAGCSRRRALRCTGCLWGSRGQRRWMPCATRCAVHLQLGSSAKPSACWL